MNLLIQACFHCTEPAPTNYHKALETCAQTWFHAVCIQWLNVMWHYTQIKTLRCSASGFFALSVRPSAVSQFAVKLLTWGLYGVVVDCATPKILHNCSIIYCLNSYPSHYEFLLVHHRCKTTYEPGPLLQFFPADLVLWLQLRYWYASVITTKFSLPSLLMSTFTKSIQLNPVGC